MSVAPTLVWFRADLRLADNTALAAAIQRNRPIVPVYILDDSFEGRWAIGGASRWWLHYSLEALRASLRERGSDLILRCGDCAEEIAQLVSETRADAVYWNRRYEPAARKQEAEMEKRLGRLGVEGRQWNSSVLFEPETVKNREGKPFQVFSPFWRTCLSREIGTPVNRAPIALAAPARWPKRLETHELDLLPKIPWDSGFPVQWTPGEAAARTQLLRFTKNISGYALDRDQISIDGSSRLSAALHFGELGPRQIWAAVKQLSKDHGIFPVDAGAQKFLSELGWREFAYHLLYHFPDTPEKPLRTDFARFPWADDPGGKNLHAWQKGRTGYPIVDAGMRQLWRTGWMPNRVRMIAASFLVKHLRLPWQQGAAWFWDTLIDADLANNTLGWQWIAGSGADAAPYFRIFSPVLQSRKFDPKSEYITRWLPEIAVLPPKLRHAPWEASVDDSTRAGFRLGRDYPRPMVDHAEARDAALAAFKALKK